MGGRRAVTIVFVALVTAAAAMSATPAGAANAKDKATAPQVTRGEVMFTLKAAGGTLSKDDPTQEPISLSFTGVDPQATWFTRSGSSGEVTTSQALAMIGFDSKPPRAVISVATTDTARNAMAVTLTHPVYDEAAATLQLTAVPIARKDVDGELERFAGEVDGELPETLGATSLFVDNRDTLLAGDGAPMVGNWVMTGSFVVPPGSTVTVKRKWDSFNNCVLEDGTQFSDQKYDAGWNDPDGHAYSEVTVSVTAVSGGSCDWERSAMHWAVSLKGRAGVADVSLRQVMAGSGYFTECQGTSDRSGVYCVEGKSMYRLPYVY